MLCCAVIAALIGLPAIIIGRYLGAPRASPLAWRPGPAVASPVPSPRPARKFWSFLHNRARSFLFAGAGIRYVVCHEPAAFIHAAASVVALGLAVALNLTPQDWRWIILAVAAVWSAEAFNTAIESTCNLLSPRFSEHVRIAKDAGAGAVLFISLGAFVIGVLTFWPYLNIALSPTPDLHRLPAVLCASAP
jgi:diacylglycerol kinase (ATP)